MRSRVLTRAAALSAALFVFPPATTAAQFNLPLPSPPTPATLLGHQVRTLFVSQMESGGIRGGNTSALVVRDLAQATLQDPTSEKAEELSNRRHSFCVEERYPLSDCELALAPDSLVGFIDATGAIKRQASNVPILPWTTSTASVARYLRHAVGTDGTGFVTQFSANVSDDEAFLVTSLVRGVVGRTLFSADQAAVVTRSNDADTAKRNVVESDKANALRAINNGGTLFARFAYPLLVRSAALGSTVIGVSGGAGVIGPISSGDSTARRSGTASGAAEILNSLPIRDPAGSNSVLADLVIGIRAGYTYAGAPLRANGGPHGVAFAQFAVGLRQNGAISVSALTTIANNGFNDLVPRLGVNFAARR